MIDDRTLNRTVLARQLLLERAEGHTAESVLAAVGGLQTQYAPSGYVGLWSRIAGLGRGELTAALEQRRVVQGTLMRCTIHMVAAADYWPLAAGVRAARRGWWLGIARRRGLPPVDYGAMSAALGDALAGGPRPRRELIDALTGAGFEPALWEAAGLWVDLVRVPPSGTWDRRRADLYGLAEDWIPGGPGDEEAGLDHVLRSYLQAFGPAPLGAAAKWAGTTAAALRPPAQRLGIVEIEDSRGQTLLDLPGLPLADPETPAPVRFLPVWEALLLVHARHAGVLPEEHRRRIFTTRNPQSVGTFLVDGRVAGTWRLTGEDVAWEPLATLGPVVRKEVAGEAAALADFHRG